MGPLHLENSEKWEIVFEKNIDGTLIEKKPKTIQPKAKDRYRDNTGISISLVPEKIDKENEKSTTSKRNIPNVSFSDIGGIDEIIEIVREVIELPMKIPDLFKHLKINPHRGILLYGPPGCGKTLIAKAIANDIKAHFISIKGPELLSKWHGQSEENLRDIFKDASKLQPSIIYFDEFDSIAQRRSSEENLRLDARFVNQLLTLMDGIEDYGNVCIIASTNRKELIDKALMRPGRFDYTIEVKKPTQRGCYEIFSIKIREMPIQNDLNINEFCKHLYGLTGAEIDFVVKEAAYNCLRRNINLKELLNDEYILNINYKNFKVGALDFQKALNTIKPEKNK